jgi:peptidoglycan hydrolase-like protein with peptidoglycan-binding domain
MRSRRPASARGPDDATVAARLGTRDPHALVDVRELQLKLARYGYDVPTDGVLDERSRRVFAAFQMHFRPSDYDGNPMRAPTRSRRRCSTSISRHAGWRRRDGARRTLIAGTSRAEKAWAVVRVR